MKRSIICVFIIVLASLFVVACGGDGDSSETETEPVTLSFDAEEPFAYNPSSASVPAGVRVTINFNNVGALEHTWGLADSDVDPATATEEDLIPGTYSGAVPQGESTAFSFPALAPGAYQIICTIPGHAVGGMLGTFTVTNDGS
jgi:nitrite reductase (NO-forming)